MKAIVLFLSLAFLASCVSTRTTSFTDPDYRGVAFKKICVYADVDDFEQRKNLEKELTKAFANKGIVSARGSDLFPPTRQWDDAQIDDILKKEGFDAYMLVQITNTAVKETPTSSIVSSTTQGENKKTRDGKTRYVETTTTSAHNNIDVEFFSSFLTEIIDINKQRTAFKATSNSQVGQMLVNEFQAMFSSYAEDIVDELIKAGHIKATK